MYGLGLALTQNSYLPKARMGVSQQGTLQMEVFNFARDGLSRPETLYAPGRQSHGVVILTQRVQSTDIVECTVSKLGITII